MIWYMVEVHHLVHDSWILWDLFEAYLGTWFMDMEHHCYMDGIGISGSINDMF
jgi:hypothetical protein